MSDKLKNSQSEDELKEKESEECKNSHFEDEFRQGKRSGGEPAEENSAAARSDVKDEVDEPESEPVKTEKSQSEEDTAGKLYAAVKRADEMLALAQRLQAEFDNYRKRTNETNKRVREDGRADVLEKLLPLIDAIEQAKKMITDTNTLNGIGIIERALDELLGGFNVVKIEALGLPFDPMLHNAIMQKEAGEEDKGKVVEVYQEGYTLGGRVLRHSVVIVGK